MLTHFTKQWHQCNANGILFKRENLYTVRGASEIKLSIHLVTGTEFSSIIPIFPHITTLVNASLSLMYGLCIYILIYI